MVSLSPLPFGPWISLSGYAITATSGTTSGYVYALNSPVTNITVQTNITSAFSGTVNVQVIGSLDGVNFFPLASGLFSGGSSNVLSSTALNGPVQYLGTQVTNTSGAGSTATITTFVWAK